MTNIDTSSWKEFCLDDILQKVETQKIHNKISDLPKYATTECTLPAIAAGTKNQGIACYVSENLATVLSNCISIAANGDGVAFYQPNRFTILQDAYAVTLKDGELTEEIALFLVAEIQKILDEKYGWNNKSRWAKIKQEIIKLPVKETEEIDWDYMQEHIEELEQEHIEELEQYLIATGLNDYELTEEEKNILSEGLEGNREWKEFLLKDIAILDNGNKMDKNKMNYINPTVNFVSRTANNNGISDFVDKVSGISPYQKGTITLAFGGSVGSCFLQDKPFYTGQNVGVIQLPDYVSKEAKMYLIATLEKKCKTVFTAFNNEINKHFKTDLSITLPIINNRPDWVYMECYIKAIEKLVIADVVKFKNEYIEKTKELTSRQGGTPARHAKHKHY